MGTHTKQETGNRNNKYVCSEFDEENQGAAVAAVGIA